MHVGHTFPMHIDKIAFFFLSVINDKKLNYFEDTHKNANSSLFRQGSIVCAG